MAFTFIVEDGTGLPNATSYVSVEEANDILAMNIHLDSSWGVLTVLQREKLLAWATSYLDAQTRWYGKKTVESSALRWPRSGVIDRDGIVIPKNSIPRQLKAAVAETARFLVDEDRTSERDQDGLKRVKADVVEIEFADKYRLPMVPSYLVNMLVGLGAISDPSSPFQVKRLIR